MSKQTANPSAQRCCPDVAEVLEPRFFRALCDPNRVAILVRLARCGGPSTVSEIAACCPTDVSVVSRHLGMLRDAGILAADKRGKKVYYSVRFDRYAAGDRGCDRRLLPRPKDHH